MYDILWSLIRIFFLPFFLSFNLSGRQILGVLTKTGTIDFQSLQIHDLKQFRSFNSCQSLENSAIRIHRSSIAFYTDKLRFFIRNRPWMRLIAFTLHLTIKSSLHHRVEGFDVLLDLDQIVEMEKQLRINRSKAIHKLSIHWCAILLLTTSTE